MPPEDTVPLSRVPLWAEMWENWPCVRDHALGSSTSVSDRAAGEGLVSVLSCLFRVCPSQRSRRIPSRAGDSGDLLCRHRASPRTAGSERSEVGRLFFTPTDWDPDGKDWDGIEGREGSPIRIKKTMDTPKKRRFRATTADT